MIVWTEDKAMEEFLDEHGVPWRYEEIPVDSIHPESQGRLSVRDVIEDTVLRYSISMDRGRSFPAICVLPNGKPDTYDIGQGRHRFAAIRLAEPDRKTLRVILAEPQSEEQRWAITCFANQDNGVPLDTAEAVEVALETLRKFPGVPQKEVAKRLGISVQSIKSAKTASEVRDVLAAKGVRAATKLSQTKILEIGRLKHNTTVMAAAAKAVVALDMPTIEIKNLVATTKRGENEQEQLDAISSLTECRKRTGASPLENRKVPRDDLNRMLHRLDGFMSKYPTCESLGLHTDHLRLTTTELWRRVRDAINEALELS